MPFMRREGGFTTPAAAVALLVALSLLFASVHAYAVGSRSGQVQYVADAGALAADGAVAAFVTAGQVVDAVLLTSSLAALAAYAASAAAAFVPEAASVSTSLANAGSKIVEFTEKFASSAQEGLTAAQEALPALVAARAAAAIEANSEASGIEYAGAALCFPAEGVDIDITDGTDLEVATSSIETATESVSEEVAAQSDLEDDLDDAKRDGWVADCGESASDKSMYERAAKLAGLTGTSNQRYSSVDSWSFKAALARAKAYYKARESQEEGSSLDSDDPSEVTDSVCRKRWYQYALEVVSEGTVTTSDGVEDPDLETPAMTYQEMKQTELYTESVWPVSKSADGTLTIHGYSNCPACQSQTAASTASISDIDSGKVEVCDTCCLDVKSICNIAALTHISTSGFEYHYLKLVEAADAYAGAADDLAESTEVLAEQTETITTLISDAVSLVATERYDPQPPGRYGCVCIVYASGTDSSEQPFIGSTEGMSARIAISGATLAADPADDSGDVICDIAAGLLPDGAGSGVLSTVLGAWSGLLGAYASGTDGVLEALDTMLSSVPIVGNTLAENATASFQDALSSSGLEAADLDCRKPVLVNTSHILDADSDSSVAEALLEAKDAADSLASATTGDLSSLTGRLSSLADDADDLLGDADLTVVTCALDVFGLGDTETSLSLSVPDDAADLLADALAALGELS